jgi:hypothetical protein
MARTVRFRRVNDQTLEIRKELERIHRVSDMLCTGHASLRDRYARWALAVDLAILGLSTWLVTLVFVQPRINTSLTPFSLDPQIWAGLLASVTLFLSIVQIKVEWKGLSDAHGRSCTMYAGVHREVGYLLASGRDLTEEAYRRLLSRYDMAIAVGVHVPEGQFLRQKRRHEVKVEISRHLDTHPAASIFLTRVKLWFRDNVGRRKG